MERILTLELAAIRTELVAGSYNPLQLERVLIRKAKRHMRPLGFLVS